MAVIRFRTFEEIREELAAYFTSGEAKAKDTREVAILGTLLTGVSALLASCWVGLADMRRAFFVMNNGGLDLRRKVTDLGMPISQGALASGHVLGIMASGTIAIPEGTLLASPGGTVVQVTSTTQVAAPYTPIPVTAVEVGSRGNMPAGTVMTPYGETITGVTFRVGSSRTGTLYAGDIAGGVDPDSDEDIKRNFPGYLKSLRGTTVEAVRQALRALPGVANLVIENAKPVPGWLTIRLSPDQEGAISQTLTTAIAEAMVAAGAAGMGYRLVPLTSTPVNIRILAQTSDRSRSPAEIDASIRPALVALTADPIPGQSLYRSVILRAAFPQGSTLDNVVVLEPATDAEVLATAGTIFVVGDIRVDVEYLAASSED